MGFDEYAEEYVDSDEEFDEETSASGGEMLAPTAPTVASPPLAIGDSHWDLPPMSLLGRTREQRQDRDAIAAVETVVCSTSMRLPGMTIHAGVGRGRWKTRKQDRRPRHTCAAKGLSAHGFARHGRAGVECRDTPQFPIAQGAFGCRVLSGALGYPWRVP